MPWTTRNVLGLIVGLVPLAFVLQIASSIGNATASTSQETRGQLLYEQSCMSCHGADAEKNFDAKKADADLVKAILEGATSAEGKKMPAFKALNEETAKALVAHMKSLKP